MRKLLFTGIITFAFGITAFAQSKHTVLKGETLYSISKKYKVTPEDIIKLNPEVKDGVKENSEILIPSTSKNVSTNSVAYKPVLNKFEYVVQPGETLYSISRKLNTSVDELLKNNPTAKDGISAGQSITYTATKKYISTETIASVKKDLPSLYTIQAEETKYSVSKKFGVSITELEELNPHIKNAFEIGMQIRLNKNVSLPKPNATSTETVSYNSGKTMNYTVQQGETLYAISRKFGISVEEITKRNPNVLQGLSTGTVLVLPEKKEIDATIQSDSVNGLKKK